MMDAATIDGNNRATAYRSPSTSALDFVNSSIIIITGVSPIWPDRRLLSQGENASDLVLGQIRCTRHFEHTVMKPSSYPKASVS